jgi:hypothetical protein
MLKYKYNNMDRKIPIYRIKSNSPIDEMRLLIQEQKDELYRIIIDHIMECIDGNTTEGETIAYIIDENENEYDLAIYKKNWVEALSKANNYFISIEEYETCDLIKQMINIINKKK